MPERKETEPKKPPAFAGSRQAVESAIDASKASQTQTWESAARQSNVQRWTRGTERTCNDDSDE
jgi:hypothetical protein